jgi:hypothetical protein
MCKGYAILINDKEIVCGETNSHSQLKQNIDGYLKVNVIYDDIWLHYVMNSKNQSNAG